MIPRRNPTPRSGHSSSTFCAERPIRRTLAVYPDKLLLWNPGQLPPEWTVDKLKGKHASQPFNPDIANAFFRAGLIEAWGLGIERMLDACRESDLPEPNFQYESSGLWVRFTFPSIAKLVSPLKTREKTREKILRLVMDNPRISLDELAGSVGITRKGMEWQIRKLKEQRRLRRVGPDKGGHWEVLR